MMSSKTYLQVAMKDSKKT